MRLQDRASGGIWTVGEYTIVKRAWERQYDIFYKGRCIHSAWSKADALVWAARRK